MSLNNSNMEEILNKALEKGPFDALAAFGTEGLHFSCEGQARRA
jgi:hypothetical protein